MCRDYLKTLLTQKAFSFLAKPKEIPYVETY
jgi:hypothetical protein